MHDNELGYEISANIMEESSGAAVFQASQGTFLLGSQIKNFIMCNKGNVCVCVFFCNFCVTAKVTMIHRKI
jgi:hypothetical protein